MKSKSDFQSESLESQNHGLSRPRNALSSSKPKSVPVFHSEMSEPLTTRAVAEAHTERRSRRCTSRSEAGLCKNGKRDSIHHCLLEVTFGTATMLELRQKPPYTIPVWVVVVYRLCLPKQTVPRNTLFPDADKVTAGRKRDAHLGVRTSRARRESTVQRVLHKGGHSLGGITCLTLPVQYGLVCFVRISSCDGSS